MIEPFIPMPRYEAEPVPSITITMAEFTLLNRRIGYLEGVWEAVSVDDVPGGVVDQVNARYKEICGGGKS